MQIKKDIFWRAYIIYILFCLFGVVVISKVIIIQFYEGEKWASKAESFTTEYKNIEAVRGNIYSHDGNLLATSIPIYEIRLDLKAEGLTREIFNTNIDSLSICLSNLFKDKTAGKYKQELIQARKDGERYYLLKRKVRYNQLKKLRTFPILRLGKFKGGMIVLQQNRRERPFRALAARTIGYDRGDGLKPVGLEGAYTNDLQGVNGKRLMQKISGGVWMPINDENEIEPKDGFDLYSTIDIHIQDVAENALLKQLQKHDAEHGCVVLMEVETGAIRAIANLSKDKDGDYYEYYNYAIGESTEPGSTFKLASLMVAIEDGKINLSDSVETGDGTYKFFDKTMKDSRTGGHGKITVQHVFEVSSNIGVSKLINKHYSKDPEKFIDGLYKLGINKPTGIEISGEGRPRIKNTKDKSWSGITLPWMSIGYEVSLTPLQILAFYNAVANNGKMVKPILVQEMRNKRELIKKFEPQVLNEKICSQSTIEKVKLMLEGVVERGTAENLKNPNYKIAGKTGTAQINYADRSQKMAYQASFVGYFPADNPKYSCIVVVSAPSKDVYYGNLVAGPIFKEVADKVYSTSLNIHKEIIENQVADNARHLPQAKAGRKKEIQKVLGTVDIPVSTAENDAEWAYTGFNEKEIIIKEKKIDKKLIPDVSGMNPADAVFILENMGLEVRIKGKGNVKKQSVTAGTKIIKGLTIVLELS